MSTKHLLYSFVFLFFIFLKCDAVVQSGITTLPTSSSTGGCYAKSVIGFQTAVLVGGTFTGTVDIEGENYTATSSSQDIFLLKYSSVSLDSTDWTKIFGGSGTDTLNALATDSNDDIIFVGSLSGSANYGGSLLTSSGEDALLVKLNSTGSHVWSKLVGGSSSDKANKVAVDAEDNIMVLGTVVCSGTVSWGGASETCQGDKDWMIAKFDTTGAFQWSTLVGGNASDVPGGIAVDSSGGVAVIGSIYSPQIQLNGHNETNLGSSDVLLIKYQANGTFLFYKYIASTAEESGFEVAFDSSDNMYICGTFYSSLNFGGGNMTSQGFGDAFLVKYTSDGTFVWQTSFGSNARDSGTSIRVSFDGALYLAGQFQNSPTFNSTPATTFSYSQSISAYVAKYSTAGTPQWAAGFVKQYGDMTDIQAAPFPASFEPNTLVDGAVLIGYFGGSVQDFNSQTVTASSASQNAIIAGVGILPSPSPSVTPTPFFTPSPSATPSVTPSPGLPFRQDIVLSSKLVIQGLLVNSMAEDSQGNIYLGGANDSYPLYEGFNSAYFAKCDSNLNILWNFFFEGEATTILSVAVDSSDDIIVAGTFVDSIQFGNNSWLKSGFNYFLAKYNSSGENLWNAIQNSNTSETAVWTVLINEEEDAIYLSGLIPYSSNGFIAKYSSAGEMIWENFYDMSAMGLVVQNNSLTACGTSEGLAGIQLINTNGSEISQEVYSSSSGDFFWEGLDTENNLIVFGSCANLLVNNTAVSGAGNYDFCLVKFDANGTLLWYKLVGGVRNDYGLAGAIGPENSIIITGGCVGPFSFGGSRIPSSTNFDFCVAMYDSDGVFQWQDYGQMSSGYSLGTAVTTTRQGDFLVAVAGVANLTLTDGTTLIFDSPSIPSAAVLKYHIPASPSPTPSATPTSSVSPTASRSSSSSSSSSSKKDDSTVGIIVGCTLGGLALIGGAAAGVLLLKKRKQGGSEDDNGL